MAPATGGTVDKSNRHDVSIQVTYCKLSPSTGKISGGGGRFGSFFSFSTSNSIESTMRTRNPDKAAGEGRQARVMCGVVRKDALTNSLSHIVPLDFLYRGSQFTE